jgi:transposase
LLAGGFARLNNPRHLIAKAGLCPHASTCGTSVRGQTRLTKMSGGLMRSKRYLCRWSACRTNHACQALYERLVAKGQHQKGALSAVCHKLLKHAFASVKSGRPYQADCAQKLAPVTCL